MKVVDLYLAIEVSEIQDYLQCAPQLTNGDLMLVLNNSIRKTTTGEKLLPGAWK